MNFTVLHSVVLFFVINAMGNCSWTRVCSPLQLNTPYGEWSEPEICYYVTYATGYNMKIVPSLVSDGDDTSLNTIKLLCNSAENHHHSVTSGRGPRGDWVGEAHCQGSTEVMPFNLQYETHTMDSSVANFVKFKCRSLDGTGSVDALTKHPGQGSSGSYRGWSNECPPEAGICGIKGARTTER